MNDKNPLFLPPGSVRSLLALILVSGSIFCVIQGVQNAEVIHALTGMAVTHYFNARGKIGSGGDSP